MRFRILFILLMLVVAVNVRAQLSPPTANIRWSATTPTSCAITRTRALLFNYSNGKLYKCVLGTYSEITTAGGGLVSTDIDTSAELRALLTDENGTGALLFSGATSPNFLTSVTVGGVAVPTISSTDTLTNKTLTAPTLTSPIFSTLVNMPRVTSLPGSPSAGDTVIVTDDSSVGACDSGAGSAVSLCMYDGASWVALGDGGGGSFSGTLGATDNTVPRSNGTGGSTFQSSSVTIDDSGNLFLPNLMSLVIGPVGVVTASTSATSVTFGAATRNTVIRSAGTFSYSVGGATINQLDATNFRLARDMQVGWSDSLTDASTTLDTGLTRSTAGTLSVTNGVGGSGNLTAGVLTATTKINIARVTSLPGSPAAGDVVIVTDDSVAGACDSGAGSAISLCMYDGASWVKLGDGTGSGGSLTSGDIDTSAELRAILTDENGTGALLFSGATSPDFTTGITVGGVAVPTISSTSTLTNKTLTSPIISTISNTGTLTLPTSTDTLVGRATTDTLTNKTLTSPVVSTKINLPRVTSLPGTPSAGDTVIVTDDSAAGACDSGGGSATTLCQYNGSAWVALGDGTTGGGGLTSGDIDTSAELRAILGDENGTGALLFNGATSPDFTTSINVTGSTAGAIQLTEGTTPSAAATNSIQLQAPTDVTTPYDLILPAASSTGLLLGTNSSNVNTLSFLSPSSANLRSTVTDENGTGALLFDGATSPNFLTSVTVGGVAVPTISSTSTLTNKTLTSPIISTISNTGTLTLPTSTDTLVGRATTDTLTNKTLTTPTLTSPVVSTKINLPRVTSLPGSPSAGDTVIVTDDSATGACDSAAGSATSLCQYNGSGWVAIGDGTAAGGTQTGIQFKDEGTNQGSSGATTIVDCVGAGITCSNSGTTLTMTVAGGGSSAFYRDMLNGSSLNPDTSGNVFLEPYANKATNDFFKQNVWVFNNPSADEKLYGSFELPAACSSGSAFKAVWTSTATSGTLQYSLAYRVITGDDTNSLDQSSAVETVTGNDTAPGAANRRMEVTITPTNSNFATAGTVQWIFTRVDTSDTVAAAITLHSLRFTCTP